jgi:hypothetical protein
MAVHILVITLALNFPVMVALARLEPWDVYSRLYGAQFQAMLPSELTPTSEDLGREDFNTALYAGGYGRRVLLPLLGFTFFLVLILLLVFYGAAAFFLGLSRLTDAPLSYQDRFGILVFSSTLPAAASALFGLWLPTVHLLVFFLAEIMVATRQRV